MPPKATVATNTKTPGRAFRQQPTGDGSDAAHRHQKSDSVRADRQDVSSDDWEQLQVWEGEEGWDRREQGEVQHEWRLRTKANPSSAPPVFVGRLAVAPTCGASQYVASKAAATTTS